ncbi:flavin reductase family protein [Pelagibius sp. Alg239-R121]|uniref:flavin reductase family protein n=1 Tax=Pelagibius sp. Alg239-R121 TaxID=2993448 RepID=UPI0024A7231C|nr:flavin reductase family protein [Pelagibius sp. Alg239-R121]
MFYETAENKHGLPHDPFKSCIVPRPIGWISTVNREGVVNLAPYSFFNGLASDPHLVMFSSNGLKHGEAKDSLTNCRETGEFVVNIATWDLRQEMNVSSGQYPAETNEMATAELEAEASVLVAPPRVKASPIHLECKTHQIIKLPSNNPLEDNAMVIGQVVGIHINDDVLTDGLVDISKVVPIARMGYMDYTKVESVFSMRRPK